MGIRGRGGGVQGVGGSEEAQLEGCQTTAEKVWVPNPKVWELGGGGREWGDLRELSLKDTKQLLRKFGCLILRYGNQGWDGGKGDRALGMFSLKNEKQLLRKLSRDM